MAYNKSKYVEAAQKLLNQGKVPQAIAEYQHILKYEPKDQVTLMTIGELYIRQGETFQAIEYFERLAQIFVGDGFLTKAIAVYKRIAKLAPEEIKPLERLADLYVQQGVMSEARPLFLQLAEIHLKQNRQAEAVGLLKKLLLAEPDNLRIQIRLADLYQAMGKSADAVEAYVAAAQRALARGDHAESEKQAEKALKLDPKNAAALTVKARSASSQGRYSEAAQFLKDLPGLDRGGEQSEFLLDLYLKDSNWEAASNLAMQAFEGDEKNFGLAQKVAEALLESAQTDRALALVAQLRIPMLDAGEQDAVVRMLNELSAKMPGRLEPLEWLVDTYGRTSDSFRIPDALAHLGDALAEEGQLERAKEIFEQLVDRQPESEAAKRKLNGVLRKLGLLAGEEEPEPVPETLQAEIPQPDAPKLPSVLAAEEEKAAVAPATAPVEAQLDEETQKFISQSLTDVDLFASYGLTQKAIGLLEAILRRAPNHTPTLEKLLDFVLGAGDDRRTAELASQLERIHAAQGDAAGEDRFAELRRRFQRAAGLTDEELGITAQKTETPPPPAVPPKAAVAPPPPKAADAKAAAHEVDLSDEWASLLNAEAAAPPAQQRATPPPPPAPLPKAPEVTEFEIPMEVSEEPVAPVAAAPPPAPPAANPAPPAPAEDEFAFELVEEEPAAVPPPANKPETPVAAKASAEVPDDQEFELVLTPEGEEDAAPQTAKPASFASPKALESDQFLADLANEIDALGLEPLAPPLPEPAAKVIAPAAPQSVAMTPSAPSSSAPAAPPADNGEHQPLKEVFDDFRAELGEMGAEDEDLETHYNLGIAFREMGLLEEAISEFQKVAKANENGKAFRYAMQCCTLLGLAFMEKGQPSIAAIWYERALHTPGIDSESIMALRYDLGVAQESANDLDAALKSFSQVYAMNIDYRDVADRIAALQKTTR